MNQYERENAQEENRRALEELARDRRSGYSTDRPENNYSSNSRFASWTDEQRRNAANNFGPNWASVLSGHGDQ